MSGEGFILYNDNTNYLILKIQTYIYVFG